MVFIMYLFCIQKYISPMLFICESWCAKVALIEDITINQWQWVASLDARLSLNEGAQHLSQEPGKSSLSTGKSAREYHWSYPTLLIAHPHPNTTNLPWTPYIDSHPARQIQAHPSVYALNITECIFKLFCRSGLKIFRRLIYMQEINLHKS